jgi:hypothetical protein
LLILCDSFIEGESGCILEISFAFLFWVGAPLRYVNFFVSVKRRRIRPIF